MAVCTMLGDHSSKGRLQSGATIQAGLRIFEDYSARALGETLAEAARLIDHKGRRWTAALDGIEDALRLHVATGHAQMESVRRVAGQLNSPSVGVAIDEALAKTTANLTNQLKEFREGWTGTLAKPWKDRQPLPYAIQLLLIGAIIGLLVPALRDALKSAAESPPVPTSPYTANTAAGQQGSRAAGQPPR